MKTQNDLDNFLDGYVSESQNTQQQSIVGMFSGWTKRSQNVAQGYGKAQLKLSTDRKKSTIFGIPLSQALERSNRAMGKQERVPRILSRCVEYLDARGCDELGIYRLSGSTKEVQALRAQFDSQLDVDLMQDFRDPNAVASLFKAYVRELPDCLLTGALLNDFYELFEDFDESDSVFPDYITAQDNHPIIQDRRLINGLKQTILKLPQENIDFLALFLRHLRKIAKNHAKNKMGLNNLQVVWSPTLNFGGALFLTLLIHVDTLFPAVNTSIPKSPLKSNAPPTPRSAKHSNFDEDITEKELPSFPDTQKASDANRMYSASRISKQGSDQNAADKSTGPKRPAKIDFGAYGLEQTSIDNVPTRNLSNVLNRDQYSYEKSLSSKRPAKAVQNSDQNLSTEKVTRNFANGDISGESYSFSQQHEHQPAVPVRKSSTHVEISSSRFETPELPPRKEEVDFFSKPVILPKTLISDSTKTDSYFEQNTTRPSSVDDYLDLFESELELSPNVSKGPPNLSNDFVGLPPVSIDNSPLLDFSSLDVKFDSFLSDDDGNVRR